ncbi:MAG: arsenate reductase (glutaredoxin) [Magnetococcales bacterium]|nr:arsenate reductase (glutaredoxin) [Magnetococcales bacterium]
MSVTIYHNPRCSKSRQGLQLLKDNSQEITVVEYLKNPPDQKTLTDILDKLGMEPRDLMRKKEKEYKENGLQDASLSREALIAAMVKFPKLIERPIVVAGKKVALGRPPENILDII